MNFRERVALTWSMTWPLLALDVLWTIVLHAAIEGDTRSAESAFAVVAFLVLGPIITRRAVQRGTREHAIAVLKSGQEARMSIADGLSVYWLLGWRSLVLMLLALLPLSLLLKLVVPVGVNDWVRALASSPTYNALGLTAVDGVTNMAFVPFLIPSMLRKKYSNFTLELRTRSDASDMKSVSPKHFKRNLSKR